MKTPLEQWWDDDVLRRRYALSPPTMPSMFVMNVCSRLGTAHELNLAQPWMRWNRVFDQLVKLQEKS